VLPDSPSTPIEDPRYVGRERRREAKPQCCHAISITNLNQFSLLFSNIPTSGAAWSGPAQGEPTGAFTFLNDLAVLIRIHALNDGSMHLIREFKSGRGLALIKKAATGDKQ
jgi:hypothetical protein